MIERQEAHRLLKRNHCNAMPRYIVAFDTETYEVENANHNRKFSHRWRLATAVYGRLRGSQVSDVRSARFKEPEAFYQWLVGLTGPNYTTWVVCHNTLFDFIIACLDKRFESGELVIDWPRSKRQREDNNEDNHHCHSLCVIESPPTIIACRCGLTQGRIVFVDTLNYFACTLAELGQSYGLEKLPQPALTEPDEMWFEYCQRDSEIVFRVFTELIQWVQENDFGMFRYTAASQAMSAFRHRFMDRRIYTHENEPVRKLERASLFGGRTDVFKLGTINEIVHQVDVTGLFPSVMQHNLFPVALDRYEIRDEHLELRPDIDWEHSIAEVELDTPYPIFPHRCNDLVTYPIGRFRTTLAGIELGYAKRQRLIIAVRSWAEYRCEQIFRLWVDELWRLRKQYFESGNRLYEQFCKLVANSLYGKFGQRAPRWQNVQGYKGFLPWSTWIDNIPGTQEPTVYRSFGWQAQYQTGREEIAGSFIAIASFVTAYARMRMNYLRELCGKRECYYQGVDGLIVTPTALERLKEAGEVAEMELGKLRLEMTIDNGEILGCSDYRLGDKVIVAGRAKTFTLDDLAAGLQRKFYATAYLFSGKACSTIASQDVEWERRQSYRKGIIRSGGWVEPFNLQEGVNYVSRIDARGLGRCEAVDCDSEAEI